MIRNLRDLNKSLTLQRMSSHLILCRIHELERRGRETVVMPLRYRLSMCLAVKSDEYSYRRLWKYRIRDGQTAV